MKDTDYIIEEKVVAESASLFDGIDCLMEYR